MKTINKNDITTVSYEMGVFLFHGLSGKSQETTKLKNYNIRENALYLFRGLQQIINETILKDGFISEAANHNVSEEDANILFEETIKIAKEPVAR
ncbi:hypothetical protein CN918_31240 [Priestia megaterium]|nr:hypothetical protein CN918_31240 [Priestia megaterium]